MHLFPLYLIACAPLGPEATAPDWDGSATTNLAPPGTMILNVDGHILGEEITFALVDAYPYEDVEVVIGLGGLDVGPCLGAFGGICLDLGDTAKRIGTIYGDVDGRGSLTTRLPLRPGLDGLELCAQLLSGRAAGGADSATSEPVCTSLGYDGDGDGLTTDEELALGTDPTRADTDGDGFPDGDDCEPLDPEFGDDCGAGDCTLPPSDCTFDAASYDADMDLSPSPGCTPMNVAFDGTFYYGYSGGTGSCRLNQWDAAGTYLGDYGPGIDGRSVFTKVGCAGPTRLNGYNSYDILVEVSPGVYTVEMTLSGGSLDSQSVMGYDHVRDLFVAAPSGGMTVDRWRGEDGTYLDSLALSGGEHDGYAQAVSNSGCYLTFRSGTLYSYDGDTGTLIDSATLSGAPGPGYSFSYANGRVFINDGSGWLGWPVGL